MLGCSLGAGDAVYLDYNATAPVRPEVVAAMAEAMAEPGNPSSVHRFGRAARARIQAVRRTLAERLDVAPDRVIFTSGGTEANHLALLGLPGPRLVSAVEHPSVLEADPDARRIRVGSGGAVDLAHLAGLLARERPKLVSIMLANNETGVIQPVREAAALACTRTAPSCTPTPSRLWARSPSRWRSWRPTSSRSRRTSSAGRRASGR